MDKEVDPVSEIARMLKDFVRCEMYSVVDRLANATSKEAVETALYEALRAVRSASGEGRKLCEGVEKPYVAPEAAISKLLEELDRDLVSGLDMVRKIVLKALAW